MQGNKTTYLLISILTLLLVAMVAASCFAFWTFRSVDVNVNDNNTATAVNITNTAVQGYLNATASSIAK
jgi:hypothetical protein